MENWQIRQEALLPGSCDLLSKKHIVVFGIGGVGGYVCEALARAGVGNFTLVDSDTVSESNKNRQIIATENTVGKFKTEAMKERMLSISPKINITCINKFVTAETVCEFIPENTDFIADAVDTVSVKLALAKYAEDNGIGIISSMGTGNKLHPELFEISDIYKTSVCPLCRSMRSRLKEMGIKALPVVYSKEEPAHITAESANGRHAPASVSFVPPVAGMIMAGYIIRKLVLDTKEN